MDINPLRNHLSRMSSLSTLIVAVDFDGTCVTHEYPRVGRDVGATPVLKRLAREGAKIILWTMRSHDRLAEAMLWFQERKIQLYGVNANPDQHTWTSSPKAYANLYIDDAALGCPLCKGLTGERPFVDWQAVSLMLWPLEEEQEPSPAPQSEGSPAPRQS